MPALSPPGLHEPTQPEHTHTSTHKTAVCQPHNGEDAVWLAGVALTVGCHHDDGQHDGQDHDEDPKCEMLVGDHPCRERHERRTGEEETENCRGQPTAPAARNQQANHTQTRMSSQHKGDQSGLACSSPAAVCLTRSTNRQSASGRGHSGGRWAVECFPWLCAASLCFAVVGVLARSVPTCAAAVCAVRAAVALDRLWLELETPRQRTSTHTPTQVSNQHQANQHRRPRSADSTRRCHQAHEPLSLGPRGSATGRLQIHCARSFVL